MNLQAPAETNAPVSRVASQRRAARIHQAAVDNESSSNFEAPVSFPA